MMAPSLALFHSVQGPTKKRDFVPVLQWVCTLNALLVLIHLLNTYEITFMFVTMVNTKSVLFRKTRLVPVLMKVDEGTLQTGSIVR